MEPGAGRAALAAKQLVVSGAEHGAMKSGHIAANLVPIINLDILHICLISGAVGRETDSLPNQKNSECCYLGEAKTEWVGRAGDRRFKCDFDAKCIWRKKTVVVSLVRRDKTKICVFGPAK